MLLKLLSCLPANPAQTSRALTYTFSILPLMSLLLYARFPVTPINLDLPLPLIQPLPDSSRCNPHSSTASSTHRSCCLSSGQALSKPLAPLFLLAWSQRLPSSGISHVNSLVLWHIWAGWHIWADLGPQITSSHRAGLPSPCSWGPMHC